MIEIKDKKLLMTYDKETEKAFKILNRFKSKKKGIFEKIAFQKNKKNKPAFYATDNVMLAEFTPICDVCLGEANRSFFDFQLDYKTIHIDKEKGLISCDVQDDYFPPCNKLFIDLKKLYGVHIPDRKDFIKHLKSVVAKSKRAKRAFFIEIFYSKETKALLANTYIYDAAIEERQEPCTKLVYTNLSQTEAKGYFDEGYTVKFCPEKLLTILKALKNGYTNFYFEKQGAPLCFEEDIMRYLLMPIF